jgi:hypothetical protein
VNKLLKFLCLTLVLGSACSSRFPVSRKELVLLHSEIKYTVPEMHDYQDFECPGPAQEDDLDTPLGGWIL